MDESLAKIRHERSKKDFPGLRLEDDEYVEFAFKRAKICLFLIFGGVGLGLAVVLLAFLLVLMGQSMIDEMGRNFLFIILAALLAAAIIIGLISLTVHRGNKLFITNRRVIQMVMTSPVVNSVNIIDLSSVEDASFRQENLLQSLFHYGTLRLSTVGDETTYTFKYSDITGEQLKEVTDLISDAKKRGRKKKETEE
ncbi:PH domain-containing protein [Candidatus Saccharibacteria bacterium]|nr:PH domain-containing protein [Candidatus Saccharibacteria bacterium]